MNKNPNDTAPGDPQERRYTIDIFCDFDGTISPVDVGFGLFDRYGRQEPWNTMAEEGRIPIREYWRAMIANLGQPLTRAMVDAFVRDLPFDPGINGLLEFAREEGIPFTVVSDGLDLYIERYLNLHGVACTTIVCNRAVLDGDEVRGISFPHAAEGCTCPSAVCKRNVVLARARPQARIVYIGDGVTDYCPVRYADIIFAKGRLAAYCNASRLPHYPFKSMADVERQLRLLLERRRIRPRYQAALLRKSAWEEE
ncbi:MAG TPA: MtnX-like HAD-IB family phosphatase [Candidatus Kapabacteria bacterium]|nr:MtnX-like HAD-IB family phosphatase [Candidatus Kapabacteria bacterium]